MATISMTRPRIFIATPLAPQEGDPGWPKASEIELAEGPVNPLIISAWRLAAFESNVRFAEKVCREIALAGGAPFAPHLLFTRFLDDNEPTERGIGMACGQSFLSICNEAWFVLPEWRSVLSTGMIAERERACELLQSDEDPTTARSPLHRVVGGNGAIRGLHALRNLLSRSEWAVRGPG